MCRFPRPILARTLFALSFAVGAMLHAGPANAHWTDWICDEDEELIMWIHGDYAAEDFNDMEYGAYWDFEYHFDDGNYSYHVRAYGPGSNYVFSGDGNLSVDSALDHFHIDFDPRGGLPTAIGGWFFASDYYCHYVPGGIELRFSDGTVYQYEPGSETDFRGYLSAEPIEWMEIEVTGRDYLWVTMDHFIVGQAIAGIDQTETFDDYDTMNPLPDQSRWQSWGDDPAAADFYATTAQAHSAPNSVVIDDADDAVQRYLGYTSGVWAYTAWVFVPEEMNESQYFILLNTYPAGPYSDWSLQIELDGANGLVKDYNGPDSLPMVKGQWTEIKVFIDLANDRQAVYYDDSRLLTKGWTDGVEPGGALDIGAVDLFAAGSTHEVYYDDLSLTQAEWPSCPADFDGDGDVDTADLLFLLGAWGAPDGDVDGDGDTDTADLLALLGAWGECP